jgi:hypothetical protein
VFDISQLTNFLTALKQPSSYFLVSENNSSGITDDYVKWVQSLANYARAIDLYLAFEIAVMHYQPSLESQLLLSMSEKELLLKGITLGLINAKKGVEKYHGVGIQEYEVEPGNRPMKMYAALGYAKLVIQDVIEKTQTSEAFALELAPYVGIDIQDPEASYFVHYHLQNLDVKSLQSALKLMGSTTERTNYWAYQTDGGQANWAEGPYYLEYALREVIPFWHAMRISNTISYNPFSDNRLLNPINWLLDILMPDARIPSIDDGNFRTVSKLGLLNWSSEYVGQNQTGIAISKKANYWLQQNTTNEKVNFKNDENLYLLELAIPKQYDLPNKTIYPVDYNGSQQKIIRFTDSLSRNHYLLMNGEHGNSIRRGEGHEQPDQLQLIYQIDDELILADKGYDKGDKAHNSSWNGYNHHNVMSYYNYNSYDNLAGTSYIEYQNNGGLSSPYIVVPGRKEASHSDVTSLGLSGNKLYT